MYVTKADVERLGGTEGCPGCLSVEFKGKAVVAHSDACRKRIADLLRASDEGRKRLEAHRRKRRERGLAGDSAKPEKARRIEQLGEHSSTSAGQAQAGDVGSKPERLAEPSSSPAGVSAGSAHGAKRPAEEDMRTSRAHRSESE